ncbi:MAG: hypothetical protein V4664_01770 [Patescibacteria group bacterium]
MNKAVLFGLTSIISLLAFVPTLINAQSGASIPGQIPEIQEQISGTINPPIPTPGQEVTITLKAFGTDLNRATITWTHNNRESLKGTGEKEFKFTASQIGKTDTIQAVIQPTNGPSVTKVFRLSPSEIDLLWEASTYTPPFYKGKALFTPQADVTFVGVPNLVSNGSRSSPDKTIYKWKVDFQVQGDKSGYGRNTFKYSGAIILRPHVFQVEGYDSNNPDVIATSKTLLEAAGPVVNIYEDHPLYGLLFNHALIGSFRMDDREKKISAYPFFFSTSNKNLDVSYQWNVNDSAVQVPPTQNSMSFQKTSKDSGEASVNIRINSTEKLLQEAFAYVALYFNGNDGLFLRQ